MIMCVNGSRSSAMAILPSIHVFFSLLSSLCSLCLCGSYSSFAKERRHLLAQQGDLLVRLSQKRQQSQIIAAHRAAREKPRSDAQQLVQLDQLAIADEDAILAHQRFDQPLELAEDFGREKGLAIVRFVPLAATLFLAEQIRQITPRLDNIREAGVILAPWLQVQAAVHLR